jgi:hypothetical protein
MVSTIINIITREHIFITCPFVSIDEMCTIITLSIAAPNITHIDDVCLFDDDKPHIRVREWCDVLLSFNHLRHLHLRATKYKHLCDIEEGDVYTNSHHMLSTGCNYHIASNP